MNDAQRDQFLELIPTLTVEKMVKLFVKTREAKAIEPRPTPHWPKKCRRVDANSRLASSSG